MEAEREPFSLTWLGLVGSTEFYWVSSESSKVQNLQVNREIKIFVFITSSGDILSQTLFNKEQR